MKARKSVFSPILLTEELRLRPSWHASRAQKTLRTVDTFFFRLSVSRGWLSCLHSPIRHMYKLCDPCFTGHCGQCYFVDLRYLMSSMLPFLRSNVPLVTDISNPMASLRRSSFSCSPWMTRCWICPFLCRIKLEGPPGTRILAATRRQKKKIVYRKLRSHGPFLRDSMTL